MIHASHNVRFEKLSCLLGLGIKRKSSKWLSFLGVFLSIKRFCFLLLLPKVFFSAAWLLLFFVIFQGFDAGLTSGTESS